MKIRERIVEIRLRDKQFGFMADRRTADAIFAVRQRMEEHRGKQDCIFIMVFIIDLENTYDRVPHQEVWRRKRDKEGFCVIEEYKLDGQWESVQNDCKTNHMLPRHGQ